MSSALVMKIVAAVVVAVVVIGGGFAISQILKPDTFEVGECVKVTGGIVDDDMESASCSDGGWASNIYRVDRVLDGTSASCYGYGYDSVEFTHEPHDKTYCLVMVR